MFQRCRNCNHTVHVTAQACTKCGFDPLFGDKFCQGCGTETVANQVICTMCGIKLGKRKVEIESQPTSPIEKNTQSVINSAEGSTTQSVVVNVGTSMGYDYSPKEFTSSGPKSRISAALLALFLGNLGIHKFYLGYNSTGVIILLVSIIGGAMTLGIASLVIWFITFIEFIIYLSMSDETFNNTVARGTRAWF